MDDFLFVIHIPERHFCHPPAQPYSSQSELNSSEGGSLDNTGTGLYRILKKFCLFLVKIEQ